MQRKKPEKNEQLKRQEHKEVQPFRLGRPVGRQPAASHEAFLVFYLRILVKGTTCSRKPTRKQPSGTQIICQSDALQYIN
ncbi:hypothetical protein Mapa_011014 [Marchantia paleacea]|nr:hypothetical protein Mapa_011014 [Marchantia paleacea]